MIGHQTRLRENDDLSLWRGSAVKRKPPFFNHVKLCAVGMRSAILVIDLWLTTVIPRLTNACYDCLPDIMASSNRACKNDARNPKKKRKLLQHLKGVNHFGMRSNSFKLLSKMCLSLRPKKYYKKAR